jgi:hypothetical protein
MRTLNQRKHKLSKFRSSRSVIFSTLGMMARTPSSPTLGLSEMTQRNQWGKTHDQQHIVLKKSIKYGNACKIQVVMQRLILHANLGVYKALMINFLAQYLKGHESNIMVYTSIPNATIYIDTFKFLLNA